LYQRLISLVIQKPIEFLGMTKFFKALKNNHPNSAKYTKWMDPK